MSETEKFYLERFGVTDRELLAAMGRVKVRDVDYADLYFEHTVDESISMEESLVKRASKSVSQGVGVRATAGEKTGYAYSDEITLRQLEQAADTARYIARSPAGAGSVPAIRVGRPGQDLYPVTVPATEVATPEKVALLERIDQVARAYDPRIKNVMASFATEYKIVLIANAEGELVGGLYGVAIGPLFAGESMFHRATDASKVALVRLVDMLRADGFELLDVQWLTPHLASLGAVEIPRDRYLELLASALARWAKRGASMSWQTSSKAAVGPSQRS